MLFIGIDLGTSAVKAVVADEEGTVVATCAREYSCEHPHLGWSEQDPRVWYTQSLSAIRELLSSPVIDAKEVRGISFGGQMHGLVVLDKDDNVIRPAILWNDGRSERECEYLNKEIGTTKLSEWCGNIAFPGFTAPKLLWMRKNEPELFDRIRKVMLPKDYLVFRLSGSFSTDVSDASGTLLFDVRARNWSEPMLDLCGLSHDQVPKVYESYERVGTLLVDIADELGLSHEVVVIAGAGDNAAAAIGCGVVDEGQCNISIGTSGTLFVPSNSFRVDKRNSLHSFADATGGYHLMGCILSAASAYSWWVQDVLGSDGLSPRDRGLDGIELGTNPVLFLPYLMGERSPVNDALARGAFVGMSLSTSQAQMTLAVMEGVAFALRDSFECARGMGIEINRVTMCGGGAKNPIWRKVIADVLDEPVCLLRREEGPGFGACILAMVGCGLFPNVASAARRFNGVEKTIEPDVTEAVAYKRMYARYGRLYPALKELFHLPEAELS